MRPSHGTEKAPAPSASVAAPTDDDLGSGPISTPTRITAPNGSEQASQGARRPCLACGGVVGPDDYCEVCGTKAASERDHFREQPAAWVAGVCDRGLRHDRNEDAMALLASAAPGEHAVLVVLDGVSAPTTRTWPRWPARGRPGRRCARRCRTGSAPPEPPVGGGAASPRPSPRPTTQWRG